MTEREKQWATDQPARSAKQSPTGARSEHEHRNRWAILDSNQHAPSERETGDLSTDGAGPAALPDSEPVALLPLLSLEDRLLVALAGRGQMSICDFLWRAFDHDPMDDDALIGILEQYAEQARDLLRGNG